MSFASLYSHGFARVAAAVPHVRIGDPAFNADRTLALAGEASEAHAALVIFPELGISGYSIDDLLHQTALLDGVVAGIERIVAGSASLEPMIVVGAPLRFEHGVFNTAVVIHRGRVLGVVPKSYLPEYREFYEKRQFRAARDAVGDRIRLFGSSEEVPFGADLLFAAGDLPAFVLHVEICEDLWVPIPPSTYGALAGATVLANLSASNITIGKAGFRRELCASQSARTIAGYLYTAAGMGESTTDLAWDGQALIYENGDLLARVRAVRDRRDADLCRPRPRPDHLGPREHVELWRLDPRPPPPVVTCPSDRVRIWDCSTARSFRFAGGSSGFRTCRRIRPAATRGARRSTASRCAGSRPGCRPPGSRRS